MINQTVVKELEQVAVRFSGDSGDGMQLTGTLFADASALYGNEISTFPELFESAYLLNNLSNCL